MTKQDEVPQQPAIDGLVESMENNKIPLEKIVDCTNGKKS